MARLVEHLSPHTRQVQVYMRCQLLPAGKSSQRVHPIEHIHQLVRALVERDVDKGLPKLAEQPAHAAIPRRVRFPIAGRGHGCAVGRLVGNVGVRVSRRQCTPAKGRGCSARRVCTAPRQCSAGAQTRTSRPNALPMRASIPRRPPLAQGPPRLFEGKRADRATRTPGAGQ